MGATRQGSSQIGLCKDDDRLLGSPKCRPISLVDASLCLFLSLSRCAEVNGTALRSWRHGGERRLLCHDCAPSLKQPTKGNN